MSSRRLAVAIAIAFPIVAQAQAAPKFDFTIANIMRGPEIYGREPSNIRWTLDGKWIYFSWLEPGSDWRLPARQFRVRAEAGAKPERVTGPLTGIAFNETGELSPDGTMRLAAGGSVIAVT